MKVGFVHIPKTGGFCVEETIKKYYKNKFLSPSLGHRETTQYYPFSFTIVREPTERFLSSYYYWRNGAIDGKYKVNSNWNPKAKTLEEFIYLWDKNDQVFLRQLDSKITLKRHHFTPQSKWINSNRKKIIILKYSNNIDLQFTKLLNFLNIEKVVDVPFQNVTKNKNTKIDNKILEWIKKTFQNDFKLWKNITEEKNIFYKIIE